VEEGIPTMFWWRNIVETGYLKESQGVDGRIILICILRKLGCDVDRTEMDQVKRLSLPYFFFILV
jgi:hypothetical protein